MNSCHSVFIHVKKGVLAKSLFDMKKGVEQRTTYFFYGVEQPLSHYIADCPDSDS